jgi:hypothetical protein
MLMFVDDLYRGTHRVDRPVQCTAQHETGPLLRMQYTVTLPPQLLSPPPADVQHRDR